MNKKKVQMVRLICHVQRSLNLICLGIFEKNLNKCLNIHISVSQKYTIIKPEGQIVCRYYVDNSATFSLLSFHVKYLFHCINFLYNYKNIF